ncbi:protease inhibitor I9 family protein [Streptomyces sp. NBC_00569]|uniref:protease inhibitor I9 family protein n=1 Tax=Streptomyces sp. NBC_00569 TaxID=2975780 RepID=UPI002E803D28|nr:protease inhibitor I9 family protein [Streptomyces sp. NBC_00569]WUB98601.1 protease inhibitor I9 family protein [Streptomyces sp. NBC_00569]
MLSSLDHQELQALHRMATLDVGGLRVTDKAALRSAKPVDVIVQLSTPPARTARLLAAARGGSLSDADAKAAVTKSHEKFRSALEDMFPGVKDKHKHTARTTNAVRLHRSYTHSFDGVSLSVPGNRVADLLKQDGVTAVWPDTEMKAFADHEAVSAVAGREPRTGSTRPLDDGHGAATSSALLSFRTATALRHATAADRAPSFSTAPHASARSSNSGSQRVSSSTRAGAGSPAVTLSPLITRGVPRTCPSRCPR